MYLNETQNNLLAGFVDLARLGAEAVAPPVLLGLGVVRPLPRTRSTVSFGVAALLLERLLGREDEGVDSADTDRAVDCFHRPVECINKLRYGI